MRPENHPDDGKGEDDKIEEAAFPNDFPNGENGERRHGENHHLAVVSAIDVGKVLRRKGV